MSFNLNQRIEQVFGDVGDANKKELRQLIADCIDEVTPKREDKPFRYNFQYNAAIDEIQRGKSKLLKEEK